jgi:hypothetical protein
MLGQEGLSNSPQSQHHSPVGQEHGRTIPLAEVAARRMCGSSLQANAAKLKKSSA